MRHHNDDWLLFGLLGLWILSDMEEEERAEQAEKERLEREEEDRREEDQERRRYRYHNDSDEENYEETGL